MALAGLFFFLTFFPVDKVEDCDNLGSFLQPFMAFAGRFGLNFSISLIILTNLRPVLALLCN